MFRNAGPRLGQIVWPGAPIQVQPGQQPAPSTAPQQPGTTVAIRVRDPGRNPVEGATVRVLAVPVHGSRQEVASGTTDTAGNWTFQRQAVPTEDAYRYDLVASKGGYVGAETTAIPDRSTKKTMILCLSEEDPLVCEVAEKQEAYRASLAEQQVTWGQNAFSGRQAHAVLRNVPVRDDRLQPYFNKISWGVADLGIPPSEWPDVATFYHQTQGVLDRVPWPKFTGEAVKISEYFRACAESRIPVAKDRNGAPLVIRDFRLYSPMWSDFFPRSDLEIRRAFAAAWAANMTSIGACVNHRIRKKLREAERSMKFYSMMGVLAVPLVIGPLGLGGQAAAVVLIGQVVQDLRLRLGEDFSENLGADLPELTEKLTQPGLTEEAAIVAIVTLLVGNYIDKSDLSPKAKAVAKVGVPKIADLVVDQYLTGETVAIPDAVLAQQAVSGALATLLSSAIRAEGIKEAKEAGRMVLGYRQQVDAAMIPFQIWLFRTLMLDKIVEEAASQAGIEDFDAERDLYDVAEEEAAKAGVDIPAEAKNPASADGASPVASDVGEGIATVGAGALILGILGTAALGG